MEGDRVLLHSPVCRPCQTPKLKSQWSGPYVIDRCINDINFVLRHEINGKRTIAHYDRIKCSKETRSSRPVTSTSSHPTTVETSNRSPPPTSTPPLLNCSTESPSSDQPLSPEQRDGLFLLDATEDNPPVRSQPTRVQPHRNASCGARHPGFYLLP